MHCLGRIEDVRWIVLALVPTILSGVACSSGGARSAATTCQPTPGQSLSFGPSGTGNSWSIRLGPGGDVPATPANVAIAQRGQPLTVSGVVYRQDCKTPLRGATVHVWQTDAQGNYGPTRNVGGDVCCYLQGTLLTGTSGKYELRTIVPGHHQNGPAHLHFEVTHPQVQGILTELQFAGDPNASGRDELTVVVPLIQAEGGASARFDIVLRDLAAHR